MYNNNNNNNNNNNKSNVPCVVFVISVANNGKCTDSSKIRS